MANWRNKLKVKDIINDDNLSIEEKAIEIAKRIRVLATKWSEENPIREEIMDIADDFESVEPNVEEFDGCLERLYDWGDTVVRTRPQDNPNIISRMCWIG